MSRRKTQSKMVIVIYIMLTVTIALTTPFRVSGFVDQASSSTRSMGSHSITRSVLQYMTLEQVSEFYQNFPLQSAVLTCGVKASVADTIAQVKPQFEEIHQHQDILHNETLASYSSSRTIPLVQKSSWQEKIQTQVSRLMPTNKGVNDLSWEGTRNLAYVIYGGIFVGLMSHIEYNHLFPFLFGNEKTIEITIEKVFFDNLIAAPLLWLPPAYFIKAWIYDATGDKTFDNEDAKTVGIFQEGVEKYLADITENNLLWKYWAIWFPAQSISFSVIPDHLRVAFMASISFFWFILFSSVSSKGDAVSVSVENDSH